MVDCAGAAVGTAFGALLEGVEDAVKTIAKFRGELKKIQTTLATIEPIIKDIDKFNDQLGRSPEEMAPIQDLLEEGKGLVNECSKIRKLYLWTRYTHSKKLTNFNAAVEEKFKIYMPLLNLMTSKETSVDVKMLGGDLKDVKDLLINVLSNGEDLRRRLEASSHLAVHAAPGFIVRSKVEASMIVGTAVGGCGKTTPLKKLCHEAAIEAWQGADVKTAFSELYLLVKQEPDPWFSFRLKKIESTLSETSLIIKKIYHLYEERDRLKEMDPIKELLEEGKQLVSKCFLIHRFNFLRKYVYSNKLKRYDAVFWEKVLIYMPLLAARNEAQILMKMEEIMEIFRSICSGQVNGGAPQSWLGALGNLAVPAAPPFMVGSEVEASLREIKLQLLKEGVSVTVVTAPGGCEKTFLLKLCHDGEIKGKFNNIMFVTVSKKPNLIGIVQQMYQQNRLEAPVIETEDGAFGCLEQLLNRIGQDPVLLVLDDVWAEWESILKKFVCNGVKDYKIVVTSYFRPVHHLT